MGDRSTPLSLWQGVRALPHEDRARYQPIAEIDSAALEAAVLEAALQLDLFTAIGPRIMSPGELATATGTHPRSLTILLDALCSLGLMDKSPAGYALPAVSSAFLVRGSASFKGDALLRTAAARRKLAAVVRDGRALGDLAAPAAAGHWAEHAAERLVTWPDDIEEELAAWRTLDLPLERLGEGRLLDLGCGAGVRSFALTRACPHLRIVAVDSAPVLQIAEHIAHRMGIVDRVTFRAGDIDHVDLGDKEYRTVLLSSLLYFFPPEAALALLSRAWRALEPDGLVVIRTSIPDEERRTERKALLDAVELLLWLPDGRAYSGAEYRELLQQAGFVDVARRGPRVVTASRPARCPAPE